MTEQEYIDATNLAKLRAAEALLRDCLFTGQSNQRTQLYRSAASDLGNLRELIEAAVNERMDADG
jgi:hypothetical protein